MANLPLYGPLDLPSGPEAAGPPGGLTLDQAIERAVAVNPNLQSLVLEIPQADADIITAGLRANPILYGDAQLVPYGSYNEQRPGGQTQYDLNISYPLDLSGKRQARVRFASRVRDGVQAQYSDAVRLTIDNLYTAFVDVLAARETVRLADASVTGLGQILELTQALRVQGVQTEADVNRIRVQLSNAEIALADSREAMMRTKRTLGALLAMHPAEAEMMEVVGLLGDTLPAVPTIEELSELAIRARPDLAAQRLGLERARSQVDLELANRFADVYVLYQPFTFQDNRHQPIPRQSATSWALGLTVPLPVYNRNQGNIQRSRINVTQTQRELFAREQQILVEVRQAEREYHISRAALERLEAEQLPAAQQVLQTTDRLYRGGEVDAVAYLQARQEYNAVVRQYRDLLVRHRRSMLTLNTAVGHRVLP